MPNADYLRLTLNLQAFIDDLRRLIEAAEERSRRASRINLYTEPGEIERELYIEIYNQLLDFVGEVFLRHCTRAVEGTEFDYPLFIYPVVEALHNRSNIERLLELFPRPTLEDPGQVVLDYQAVFGDHTDYIMGIEATREILKSMRKNPNKTVTPQQASFYWKYAVYLTGREGFTFLTPKQRKDLTYPKKSLRVRASNEELSSDYAFTISTRLEYSGQIAPWLEILEYGVAGLIHGPGYAYPAELAPRHFIRAAETELNELLYTIIYPKTLDMLYRRYKPYAPETSGEDIIVSSKLEMELESLLDYVIDVITEAHTSGYSYKPGDILGSAVGLDNRERYLYITSTNKIGFSLDIRSGLGE